jgi:ribonuclease HII
MILGIDEAGRGPVMGPMVLCGVWIRPSREARLRQLGIRDSKTFGSTTAARARRQELGEAIRELAERVTVLVVDAAEVDRWVGRGKLNQLERELARVIIESGLAARRIVADGARLFGPLASCYGHLEAIDKADATETAVAAASILAKVERDARYGSLVAPYEQELGPIRGGGYANKGTAAFLREYVARHRALPAGVRRSWTWPVLTELGFPPLTQQLTLSEAPEWDRPL